MPKHQNHTGDPVDPAQASVYEHKLRKEWRSLLEDDSLPAAASDPGGDSFFFRPKGALGLDPGLDPSSFVRQAGDDVGDYHLERLVGQGAMGQVWEALQVSLQRTVALKLIRPDSVTPEFLRFFRREGRAGGRLTHPNIVAVYGMGQADGVHWIAQEFVDGECTLGTFLDEARTLEELPPDYDRRMALFFYQLCEALQYAHGAGVVHRDMKPQNVLVAHGDRPKLTDFGLARIVDEGSLSEAGAVKGTPRYMSPEQALGLTDRVDARSDQFGLGAMLYEALTLQPAFDGDSIPAVLSAVVKSEPVRPTKLRPEMSRDLEAIVIRAIEKRPGDRYGSMGAFAEDLARYLDGRAPRARSVGLLQRLAKWVRRNPVATGIGFGVLVMALVVGVLVNKLGSSEERATLEQWRVQVLEARGLMERGRHAAATQKLAVADGLRPEEPDTMLLLAGSAVRLSRYREAGRLLSQATERGYDPGQASADSAEDSFQLGLYHFALGRLPEYPLAAAAFERALALDSARTDVWYPLYQIRAALEDHEGAAEALRQYRQGLTLGDPQARFVEALLAEQEGRVSEARQILEALLGEDRGADPGWDAYPSQRSLGRLRLLDRDFEGAIQTLQEALQEVPDDSDSWSNLALASLFAASQAERESDAWRDLIQAGIEAGETARELQSEPIRALRHLALLQAELGGEAAAQALAELEAADPQDPVLVQIQQSERLRSGFRLWDAGSYPEAVAEFQAAIDLGPACSVAHIMIGQDLYYGGTPETNRLALEQLGRAFELWTTGQSASSVAAMELGGPRELGAGYVQVMLLYRFACAARLGELAVARESREALEEFLLEVPFLAHAEQLTYAEALVHEVPDELRDGPRARSLFEDYLESTGIEMGGWPPEYAETIEHIRAGIESK